jgi:hypothetical protein
MARSRCPVALSKILAGVFRRVGLRTDQYDLSRVEGLLVTGFPIGQRTAAAASIEAVLQANFVSITQINGKVTAIREDGEPVASIPAEDIGARLWQSGGSTSDREGLLELELLPERELPFAVDLSYFDIDGDYVQGTQRATRYTAAHLWEVLTINTPLTLTADEARRIAEATLYRLWLRRTQGRFSAARRWLNLAPGDVIEVPTPGGQTLEFLIVGQTVHPLGPVSFNVVLHDAAVLQQEVSGAPLPVPTPHVIVTETQLIAWSGNALRDEDADSVGFYAAANGAERGEWPGAALYLSRDGGGSYQLVEALADPAPWGTAENALPAGPGTAVWDNANTLTVTLMNGTLETTSVAEVLNGANGLRVGQEYLQFVTATPLAADVDGNPRYTLSQLLRGQRGTDGHWSSHAADERVLGLGTGWVKRIPLGDEAYDTDVLLKVIPEGGSLPAVTPVTLHITGDERKPWAPVHHTAARQANQDLVLGWTRRSRKPGVGSLASEPGNDNPTNRYDVEILNAAGTTVLRSFLNVTGTAATWNAADQIADAGDHAPTVRFRVFELGVYGRGFGGERTVVPSGTAWESTVGGGGVEGLMDFSDEDNSALIVLL